MSDSDDVDLQFEFEHKFLVRALPGDVVRHDSKQVIVQACVFAVDGYAVRVRISFPGRSVECPAFDEATDYLGAYERQLLTGFLADAEDGASASMAVKLPAVQGECYKMESSLDLAVAAQIVRRYPTIILKNRYSFWYNRDGWEFDVFADQNEGLIMAECEWLASVVDLRIPEFCVTEISDDMRFTNDYLLKEPWKYWGPMYAVELAAHGLHFMKMDGNGGGPGGGVG